MYEFKEGFLEQHTTVIRYESNWTVALLIPSHQLIHIRSRSYCRKSSNKNIFSEATKQSNRPFIGHYHTSVHLQFQIITPPPFLPLFHTTYYNKYNTVKKKQCSLRQTKYFSPPPTIIHIIYGIFFFINKQSNCKGCSEPTSQD